MSDDSNICSVFNQKDKTLSVLSILEFLRDYSSCLDAHRSVYGMQLGDRRYYTRNGGDTRPTIVGGLVCRWLHFDGHKAA